MRRAAADRAEETQTRFTSSKLLPADQFLRNPSERETTWSKRKGRGAGGGSHHVVRKCF